MEIRMLVKIILYNLYIKISLLRTVYGEYKFYNKTTVLYNAPTSEFIWIASICNQLIAEDCFWFSHQPADDSTAFNTLNECAFRIYYGLMARLILNSANLWKFQNFKNFCWKLVQHHRSWNSLANIRYKTEFSQIRGIKDESRH